MTPAFVAQTAERIHYRENGAAENEISYAEESAAPPAQAQFSVHLKLTLDIQQVPFITGKFKRNSIFSHKHLC